MSSNIRVQRICEGCGQEFTARTTVTRFCSDRCATRAAKDRARGQKVEKSNTVTYFKKHERSDLLKAKEILTIEEACELTSISRWTLWRAIKGNRIPSARLGKRVLIRRVDINNLFGRIEESPNSKDIRHGIKCQADPDPLSSSEQVRIQIDVADCYSIGEALGKYGLSESALQNIIRRNNIPRIKAGNFVYIPKTTIDKLFNL